MNKSHSQSPALDAALEIIISNHFRRTDKYSKVLFLS